MTDLQTMNKIIEPCPAQFLEITSHAARTFRVQPTAVYSLAHLCKSCPIYFLHQIWWNHFVLDQPCPPRCCLLCMVHTEQAAGLGSTASLFCMRGTRTSHTTQHWQRRAFWILGSRFPLEMVFCPWMENPVTDYIDIQDHKDVVLVYRSSIKLLRR